MGVVYYNGVGIGYVDTVLHNGCREQYIVIIIHESHENLLQFVRVHLSVTYRHTGVGHIFVYEICYLRQIGYAVVDKINLSVAAHLEVYRVGYYLMTEGCKFRLYRITVWWRSAYDAHIARSHKRELQGAWYRCGRHSERIDVGFQLAQLLFCRYSELLFLINDKQSEVVPNNRLAYQFVCSHENVYLSGLEILDDLTCLLGRTCTREIIDAHRQITQTVAEGLVMLESQHRGRHEHSHLLVVTGSLEGGTHGHLGLTEANVAAHQAVHRARTLHIGLHLLRGLELIGRVLI